MLHVYYRPHDYEPIIKILGLSTLADMRVSTNQVFLSKYINGSIDWSV